MSKSDASIRLERTLTAAQLRSIFDFDPVTGFFLAKNSGKRIGSVVKDGYRAINIKRRFYAEHRLAWLYAYGEWPKDQIDHINCIPDDNRLANLREATPKQNAGNTRPHEGRQFKGITWTGYRWRARIRIGDRDHHLGCFDTEGAANAAYLAKAIEIFGDFARAAA